MRGNNDCLRMRPSPNPAPPPPYNPEPVLTAEQQNMQEGLNDAFIRLEEEQSRLAAPLDVTTAIGEVEIQQQDATDTKHVDDAVHVLMSAEKREEKVTEYQVDHTHIEVVPDSITAPDPNLNLKIASGALVCVGAITIAYAGYKHRRKQQQFTAQEQEDNEKLNKVLEISRQIRSIEQASLTTFTKEQGDAIIESLNKIKQELEAKFPTETVLLARIDKLLPKFSISAPRLEV